MVAKVRFFTLVLVMYAQAATAQIAPHQSQPGMAENDILLVQAVTLTESDQRRLDFYADKIVTQMVEIRAAEVSGDAGAVRLGSNQAQGYAERFGAAAKGFGLTERQTADYFLTYFSTAFSGPLPNALLSADGNFDFRGLFYDTADTTGGAASAQTGYIDQLRDQQNIGGIAGSD